MEALPGAAGLGAGTAAQQGAEGGGGRAGPRCGVTGAAAGPLEPAGPLRPLSAFSEKLVVLVTVSRLWLGTTYQRLPWGSVECSRTPRMDSSGIGGQGGQAGGWPTCSEIMPKRHSASPGGSGLAS